jgi:hypothetical protein
LKTGVIDFIDFMNLKQLEKRAAVSAERCQWRRVAASCHWQMQHCLTGRAELECQ